MPHPSRTGKGWGKCWITWRFDARSLPGGWGVRMSTVHCFAHAILLLSRSHGLKMANVVVILGDLIACFATVVGDLGSGWSQIPCYPHLFLYSRGGASNWYVHKASDLALVSVREHLKFVLMQYILVSSHLSCGLQCSKNYIHNISVEQDYGSLNWASSPETLSPLPCWRCSSTREEQACWPKTAGREAESAKSVETASKAQGSAPTSPSLWNQPLCEGAGTPDYHFTLAYSSSKLSFISGTPHRQPERDQWRNDNDDACAVSSPSKSESNRHDRQLGWSSVANQL